MLKSSIIPKLSSSLDRRDEVPNQELARQIVQDNDKSAVQELIDNLSSKQKGIANDSIKVLYEIGEKSPALISSYSNEFIAQLKSKNNRLQWGAMAALNAITLEEPKTIFGFLAEIIQAMDGGSVITKDNGVNILIKLCTLETYKESCFSLFIEQLHGSPTNQLPMYAERAIPIINESNQGFFVKTLSARLGEIEKESKRKRVEKVIRKFA